MNCTNTGYNPRTGSFITIKTICGKGAEFEKWSVTIEQLFNSITYEKLVSLFVLFSCWAMTRAVVLQTKEIAKQVTSNKKEVDDRLREYTYKQEHNFQLTTVCENQHQAQERRFAEFEKSLKEVFRELRELGGRIITELQRRNQSGG